MTAGLKAKLRQKNRLMRKGRVEEARALAKRIGKTIENRNNTRIRLLRRISKFYRAGHYDGFNLLRAKWYHNLHMLHESARKI